ncbi:MAG: DUF1566 domain-containing protein [Sphaerochaetaceae bacterium]|nr:DUF1566 domain-containing protein [Sphaerochaetaceae bacterium]
MRKFVLCILSVLMVLALVSCDQAKDPKYEVGETGPAGGIIFYVDASKKGITYYEAAPKSAEQADVYFGNFYDGSDFIHNLIDGADTASVGTGKTNTAAIMAVSKQAGIKIYRDQFPENEITDFAAKVATSCTAGGKNDWYLPSLDELNLMYNNLKKNGLGQFENANYWTSTQSEMQSAVINFVNGELLGGKNYEYQNYVRPIRSFN